MSVTNFNKPLDDEVALLNEQMANKIVYERYSATPATNSYVTPFSAYASIDITKSGYLPIAAQQHYLSGTSQSTVVVVTNIEGNTCHVYCNKTVTIYICVTYIKT